MIENKRGRSLITIMMIIAVLSLFLRFGIERVIKITIAQNESNARLALKMLSTALESYAHDHLGTFPTDLSILTQENPAYLDKDYLNQSPIKGYYYNCLRLADSGYSCSATPVRCNISGKVIYSITTGGLFVAEECSRKEKE